MTNRKREPWKPLLRSYPASRKVNQLSFQAETMYTRLIAEADDLGNYDADPTLMMSGLFARRVRQGQMDIAATASARDELVNVDLACLYEVDGELYVHLKRLFRLFRKDVKPDVRFPEYSESLVVKGLPEHGPKTGRKRNEHGPNTGRTRAEHGPLNKTRQEDTRENTNTTVHSQEEIRQQIARAASAFDPDAPREPNLEEVARAITRTEQEDFSLESLWNLVAVAYPNNRTVRSFFQWWGNTNVATPDSELRSQARKLSRLIGKSFDADSPAAWFITAVKRQWGYRPQGKMRDETDGNG